MPTEALIRFVHHVVFHSPATLAGIVIGGLGGAITGLWDPIAGGFIGLALGFAASSALGLGGSWQS
jgi:hypothetical protein